MAIVQKQAIARLQIAMDVIIDVEMIKSRGYVIEEGLDFIEGKLPVVKVLGKLRLILRATSYALFELGRGCVQ